MNNDVLANRLILRHCADVTGIPQGVVDFAHLLRSRSIEPADGAAERAARELATLGYLSRCEATAGDDALYKITASGLRQISRRVPAAELDPMVWG